MKNAFIVMLFLVVPNSAIADTVRLSQMTREIEVAIQRGYSIAEGACVFSIIKEIDAYGGRSAMREFRISFENEPLRIFTKSITHTCDRGIHRMREGGKTFVLQRYDDNGQPTMTEGAN